MGRYRPTAPYVPGPLYERLNEVLEEGASMRLLGADRVNTKPEVRARVASTTVLKLSALGYGIRSSGFISCWINCILRCPACGVVAGQVLHFLARGRARSDSSILASGCCLDSSCRWTTPKGAGGEQFLRGLPCIFGGPWFAVKL